ncbi:vegetative cell wall protein gp1-like [Panicum virgatum]|uniref:Uncharacterized protein n=1 Tax=Panicum virgatum TaxID=38727 RepID=A0A8T0VWT0_PANVG|nr:vegetative cell wall protein gp1-like [Panicum virgatum]KAG2639385.1 hypothetical protein PVAP13_2KG014200 [Panicum virgatum]
MAANITWRWLSRATISFISARSGASTCSTGRPPGLVLPVQYQEKASLSVHTPHLRSAAPPRRERSRPHGHSTARHQKRLDRASAMPGCYVGKATKIFLALLAVLAVVGVVLAFRAVLHRAAKPGPSSATGTACEAADGCQPALPGPAIAQPATAARPPPTPTPTTPQNPTFPSPDTAWQPPPPVPVTPLQPPMLVPPPQLPPPAAVVPPPLAFPSPPPPVAEIATPPAASATPPPPADLLPPPPALPSPAPPAAPEAPSPTAS